MRPGEFSNALRCGAGMLPADTAATVRTLADVFAASSEATVAAVLKRLSKSTLNPTVGNPNVQDTLADLKSVMDFAKEYCKPAFYKDLNAVAVLCEQRPEAGFSSLMSEMIDALNRPIGPPAPVLNEDVVQRHLRRLEQTLGDQAAFTAAYNDLDRDPEVGKLEITELAKRFTERAVKSRAPALKKIWARHNSLVGVKGKGDSRVGRSAG